MDGLQNCQWCDGHRETLPLGMCKTHAIAHELLTALESVLAKMPFGANWDGRGNNPQWLKDAREVVRKVKATA